MSEVLRTCSATLYIFYRNFGVGRLAWGPPLEFMQTLRRDEAIPPYVGFVFYLKDINGVRDKAPS